MYLNSDETDISSLYIFKIKKILKIIKSQNYYSNNFSITLKIMKTLFWALQAPSKRIGMFQLFGILYIKKY